ncbi:MAG: amidohydrolase family protein [Deltaproteobacteria bacterium]|nr:amidohydrolase family protein [Deltaproteobacteria bacterium]
MIIDGHAHACGEYLQAESILHQLNTNNVDKVILVPGELNSKRTYSLPNLGRLFPKRNTIVAINHISKVAIALSRAAKHIYEGNANVHKMASAYPERIIQFYWVRMGRPTAFTDLQDDYQKYQFKGIKLHQCWERFRFHSSLFSQIGQFALNHKLPLFAHVWSNSDLVEILAYKKEHPELVLIVAHLFGVESYIQSELTLPNVYFEISSPSLISNYRLKMAIQQLGANKIIMGTDIPYGKNNLARTLERIRALQISDEEKELILGQNMAQILT